MGTDTTRAVCVVDVHIPFKSMVWFLFKGAIAVIPALLLLTLFSAGVVVALSILGVLSR